MEDFPIPALAENESHPMNQNFVHPALEKNPPAVDSRNKIFISCH